MESTPAPATPWKRLALISGLVVVAIGIASLFLPQKPILESDPAAVRAWADCRFLELTKPVPSSGSPLDPRHLAHCSPPGPATNGQCSVLLTIDSARSEYVPDYEVLEFDAESGFTGTHGSGKLRWIAAKAHAPDPEKDWDPPRLDFFHPDGKPIAREEEEAMGIGKADRSPRSIWIAGMTNLQGHLELSGYQNPRWKLQDVLDSATHVSVLQNTSLRELGSDHLFSFSVTVAALHDAPLVIVIDLAHGPTEDFELPVSRGATAANGRFHFEVMDVFPGIPSLGVAEWPRPETFKLQFGTPDETTKTFSVIHHTNPPAMSNAVSVEALDAEGNTITNHYGEFMQLAPASRFGAPLAEAAKLRVRYRPHLTRLLLHLDPMPGVAPANSKPSNLFDVRAPRIVFSDAFQMRRFISDTTQLKDISGSISYHTESAFPMTLEKPSPRVVVERYLNLDTGRKAMVDPAAQTIAFEQPKKNSRISGVIDWLRMQPWWP